MRQIFEGIQNLHKMRLESPLCLYGQAFNINEKTLQSVLSKNGSRDWWSRKQGFDEEYSLLTKMYLVLPVRRYIKLAGLLEDSASFSAGAKKLKPFSAVVDVANSLETS